MGHQTPAWLLTSVCSSNDWDLGFGIYSLYWLDQGGFKVGQFSSETISIAFCLLNQAQLQECLEEKLNACASFLIVICMIYIFDATKSSEGPGR